MNNVKARLALCVEHVRRSGRDGIDTRSLSRKLHLGVYKTGVLCRALAEHGLVREYGRRWMGTPPVADEPERIVAAMVDVMSVVRKERVRTNGA